MGGVGVGGGGPRGIPDMRTMSTSDAERVNSEIRRRSLANGFGLDYLRMEEDDTYSAMVSPVQFNPSVTLEEVMGMPPAAVQMMAAGYGGALMGHYNTPGTTQQTSGPSPIMMAAPASPAMTMPPQRNRLLQQQQQSLQPMADVNMGSGPGRGTFWGHSPYSYDGGGPRLSDEPENDLESSPLASPHIASTSFVPTATTTTGAVVEQSALGTLEKPPGGMVPSKFPENVYSSSGFNMLDILVSMNFIFCSRAYIYITLHIRRNIFHSLGCFFFNFLSFLFRIF